jgi:putative transposase
MPRIPRGQQAGFVYHVINRGNGRATIFHKPQDYFGLRLFQTFQTA